MTDEEQPSNTEAACLLKRKNNHNYEIQKYHGHLSNRVIDVLNKYETTIEVLRTQGRLFEKGKPTAVYFENMGMKVEHDAENVIEEKRPDIVVHIKRFNRRSNTKYTFSHVGYIFQHLVYKCIQGAATYYLFRNEKNRKFVYVRQPGGTKLQRSMLAIIFNLLEMGEVNEIYKYKRELTGHEMMIPSNRSTSASLVIFDDMKDTEVETHDMYVVRVEKASSSFAYLEKENSKKSFHIHIQKDEHFDEEVDGD